MAVPVCNDSELVATLTQKLRDLERQVKAQTDEILSKVGPQRAEGQGLVPGVEGPGLGRPVRLLLQ